MPGLYQSTRGAMAGMALLITSAVGSDEVQLRVPGLPHIESVSGRYASAMNGSAPIAAPALYMDIAPERAEVINDRRPLALASLEAAQKFYLPASMLGLEQREKEADCLAEAIYYEAGAEAPQGQRAVAQVVLNRLRHPAFPNSICAVVFQGSERSTGCQFTFTCDGSLARRPWPAGWARAKRIAADALAGRVEPAVGMATHYHTRWVVPYWSWDLEKISVIGAHIFYRWSGHWGHRAAFSAAYSPPGPADSPDSSIQPVPDQSSGVLALTGELLPGGPRPREDDKIVSLSAPYQSSKAAGIVKLSADYAARALRADEQSGILRSEADTPENSDNARHEL